MEQRLFTIEQVQGFGLAPLTVNSERKVLVATHRDIDDKFNAADIEAWAEDLAQSRFEEAHPELNP